MIMVRLQRVTFQTLHNLLGLNVELINTVSMRKQYHYEKLNSYKTIIHVGLKHGQSILKKIHSPRPYLTLLS